MLEERVLARRADAGTSSSQLRHRPSALGVVRADGEAARLVAQTLHEAEHRIVGREAERRLCRHRQALAAGVFGRGLWPRPQWRPCRRLRSRTFTGGWSRPAPPSMSRVPRRTPPRRCRALPRLRLRLRWAGREDLLRGCCSHPSPLPMESKSCSAPFLPICIRLVDRGHRSWASSPRRARAGEEQGEGYASPLAAVPPAGRPCSLSRRSNRRVSTSRIMPKSSPGASPSVRMLNWWYWVFWAKPSGPG